MNKVIQAVGRVIRRQSDYGIAILLDDRFQKWRLPRPNAESMETLYHHQTPNRFK